MMKTQPPPLPERRSFLNRLNAGAASVAALAMSGIAMAQVKPRANTPWEPARHQKDDWLDELPGKHRMVFDTTTADGLGDALLFTSNFIRMNRSDYGLESGDLAMIIIVRHRSTAFAFNDAMWTKYGVPLAARSAFEDPKTKAAPKANVFLSQGYGEALNNRGTTLDAVSKQGVQIAVCSLATRAIAGLVAGAVGGSADAIFGELISNLVSNARMVPAGIVAVNRAQERGYSLVSA